MRWVFIKPRCNSPYYDPEIQEPLGLEYLAASRRSHGDAVLLLDGSLNQLPDIRLARRAVAFQPDAIGLSITTAEALPSVLAIHAECLKALRGRPCRWVAGGNFVSSESTQAARLLPESFVLVRYEGEIVLDMLADAWSGRGAESTLPFVMPRVIDGVAVADLDALPWPVRAFSTQIMESGWAFNLQGSRGCCGSCRYCSSPGMRGAVKHWRGRSVTSTVDEMQSLEREYGARSFNFVDEDFLGPPASAQARALNFATLLQTRAMRISFGIQVRPASLGPEAINALASVGLTYVFLGIESDSPEDFQRWGRPWTENAWQWIEQLRKHNVEVNAGTLMFHSHSTLAGIRRFATRLHGYGLLEYRSARNRLDAMPGSHFYEEGIRTGVFSDTATGPQPLPFEHPEVERFYDELLNVLDPLGPPSMHALCALPPLLSAQYFDSRAAASVQRLKAVIARMDAAVAESFFSLLDCHENRTDSSTLPGELRQHNFDAAIVGAQQLAELGFAPFDALRKAIRMDAKI